MDADADVGAVVVIADVVGVKVDVAVAVDVVMWIIKCGQELFSTHCVKLSSSDQLRFGSSPMLLLLLLVVMVLLLFVCCL